MKRLQTITTSIENTAEMSVIFAETQQHNAYAKTRHALSTIGVGWGPFEEILEEIGVKLRKQVISQHLDTTHSKIRSKLRQRAIVKKSQQVVGCTQKLMAIVKIPKKNSRERRAAPVHF